MLGQKYIPIPSTVYLFSGAGGLWGGGGKEGEPQGAVKLQGEWVAHLQCILSQLCFSFVPSRDKTVSNMG